MAKCTRCGRVMDSADGCSVGAVMIDAKVFDRIRVGDPGDPSEGRTANRCRDCNALHGNHHHWCCDSERCPACGRLLTSCGCGEVRAISNPASPEHNDAVRALCYSRVADANPGLLDWQSRRNVKYAREQGYNVVVRIEESGSGRAMNRPGIQQVVMHVKKHDFDVLIIDNLSRLGRNPARVIPLLRRLRENGIRVVSPRQGNLGELIGQLSVLDDGIRKTVTERGVPDEVV